MGSLVPSYPRPSALVLRLAPRPTSPRATTRTVATSERPKLVVKYRRSYSRLFIIIIIALVPAVLAHHALVRGARLDLGVIVLLPRVDARAAVKHVGANR